MSSAATPSNPPWYNISTAPQAPPVLPLPRQKTCEAEDAESTWYDSVSQAAHPVGCAAWAGWDCRQNFWFDESYLAALRAACPICCALRSPSPPPSPTAKADPPPPMPPLVPLQQRSFSLAMIAHAWSSTESDRRLVAPQEICAAMRAHQPQIELALILHLSSTIVSLRTHSRGKTHPRAERLCGASARGADITAERQLHRT
eukprot:4770429-Prymnesium_polylepis.1